jgi:outer membrane protein assembly factor BamD
LHPMLKKISILLLVLSTTLVFVGCVDNFEKIRRDPGVTKRLNAAMEYYNKGEWQKAQYLFEDLMPIIKVDTIGEKIYYLYAQTHYQLANYNFASHYFKQFTNTYPNSRFAEDATYMTAYALFKMSPTYRLEQTNSMKAIEGFQYFANTYSSSPKVAECNKIMDELRRKLEFKDFESASLYLKLGEYQSAVHTFKHFLEKYPDADLAEKARFMILKAEYNYAVNSIENKQLERLKEMQEHYLAFIDKYPSSPYIKEAESLYNASQKQIKKISLR